MPKFDLVVESRVPRTVRVQQLEGMFDVPAQQKLRREWNVDIPIDAGDWQIGLIVGPSGSGKSQVARRLFGEAVDKPLTWHGDRAVVDEFDKKLSMEVITATCSAVGFNTVPSWMKPFHVLSNGEKFRVELARRLIEGGELVAVDEFTSVVDRQVAKIASHAVQKFVRKRKGQKFVAITCHYDVLDWLQPDWVYDPSTGQYAGRSLRRRPELDVVISQVSRSAWPIFAAYHYMSRNLHKGARCYGLWLEGKLTAFCGVLYRPTPGNVRNKFSRKIWGVSRVVTLPDYQGLGLAFVLIETLGAAYRGIGCHFHSYPAHPSFAHSHDRSANWQMRKRPGVFSTTPTKASSWMVGRKPESRIGGRPCAVFRYVGPAMPEAQARVLIGTGQADDIE